MLASDAVVAVIATGARPLGPSSRMTVLGLLAGGLRAQLYCDSLRSSNAISGCMRHLTIRQVPPELARALEEEKRRRGQSLNRTVLDLLAQALGLRSTRRRSNGLGRFSGTWTQDEFEEFERAVEEFERVDEELWR